MSDRFGYGEIGLGIESGENDKQTTNADRIRSMTDEELAQFFHDSVACDDCSVGDSKCKRAFALCKNTALAWLKSQVGVQDG